VADLVVVDGDPLSDVRILRDPDRIWMVVQGGKVVRGRNVAAGAGLARAVAPTSAPTLA
jgi:hypothetical protein